MYICVKTHTFIEHSGEFDLYVEDSTSVACTMTENTPSDIVIGASLTAECILDKQAGATSRVFSQ